MIIVITNKPLRDLKFEELVSLAAGNIILGIGRGEKFSSLIHQWLHTTLDWGAEQDRKMKEVARE